ncbi:MAG: alanine racemase [Candidatus Babeliales bacterium]
MYEELQQRPTYININLSALEHNFHAIQAFVGSAHVMPIVKGNAYGHGLIECAQHLQKIGASWLGVALLEEGIALRKANIKVPIVVLGGILHRQIELFLQYDLDINAASLNKLESIEQHAKHARKRARIHLEIDTGIERTGIHYYNAHKLIEYASTTQWCDVVGIFSHFAMGEEQDLTFARTQLERFKQSVAHAHIFANKPLFHIAASGAILQFPESHLDMVRPGLIMYGIVPAPHMHTSIALKAVMALSSRVVYFKVVKEGAGVSYGLTWKAPKDTRVITVPLGYGDGFNRQFMHGGQVIIRGKRYPIIGRICMDQFMVDIGQDEVYNDEEVIIIGKQGSHTITLEELASTLPDGNAREITTMFGIRLPRKFLQ